MAREALTIWILCSVWAAIQGQETHPPITPSFPPPPTFSTVINSSFFAFVGEPVVVPDAIRAVIDCSQLIDPVLADGNVPDIRWTVDGNPPSGPYAVSADQSQLIIARTAVAQGAQRGTSATIVCEVCIEGTAICSSNSTDLDTCEPVELDTIIDPPTLLNPVTFPPPTGVPVRCGQDAELSMVPVPPIIFLSCPILAGTNTECIWYYNGEVIDLGSVLAPTGTAITLGADGTGFGTYTLVCDNECSAANASTTIRLEGVPPDIRPGVECPDIMSPPPSGSCDSPPSPLPSGNVTYAIGVPGHVSIGQNITIECAPITGDTPIEISWFRNGVVIPEYAGQPSITITVGADDENTVYTCRAENMRGFDMCSTVICPFGDPPDIRPGVDCPSTPPNGSCDNPPSPFPRTAVSYLIGEPAYVEIGQDLTIECQPIVGLMPINITWSCNGVARPDLAGQTSITIDGVTENERGTVCTCMAENAVGTDTCSSAICPFEPPMVIPAPTPSPPPEELPVVIGEDRTVPPEITTVTIYCPVTGFGVPIVTWTKDGMVITSGGRITITTITPLGDSDVTSVLTITNFQMSDAGVYQCTGTNVVGDDDQSTTLQTECPDCPPPGFQTMMGDTCPTCGVWETGDPGPCSPNCHRGMQQVPVFCVNFFDNTEVLSDAACNPATRPADTQSCGTGPCSTGWRKSPWTPCSKTCHTGQQMRMVDCVMNDVVMPDENCDAATMPTTIRFCNNHVDCACVDMFPTYCRNLMGTDKCEEERYRTACCWSCGD